MSEVHRNDGIIGNVNAHQVAVGANVRAVYHGGGSGLGGDVLVPMRRFDSFRAVEDVPPESVRHLPYPLQVPERTIKRLLAEILSEPFVPNDHGGEMDDLYTTRVLLDDREVTASFLLKGPGVRVRGPGRRLVLAGMLGRNGDQIERMMTQPAEVFVVQYVGQIDTAVSQRLKASVIACRAQGNPRAVGTIWDGVDTARLLAAYGYLDPETGNLLPAAEGRDPS